MFKLSGTNQTLGRRRSRRGGGTRVGGRSGIRPYGLSSERSE